MLWRSDAGIEIVEKFHKWALYKLVYSHIAKKSSK